VVRRSGKARRLVVGDETYLWSVRHTHGVAGDAPYAYCTETVVLRRWGTGGCLRAVFAGGPGRLVPDGYLPSGAVGTAEGGDLNLHEPGTARALLDEALARGWDPGSPPVEVLDGWTLFDAVHSRREPSPETSPETAT
jgi:hypothetical protein